MQILHHRSRPRLSPGTQMFSTSTLESLRRPLGFEPGFSTNTTAFPSRTRNWEDVSEGGEGGELKSVSSAIQLTGSVAGINGSHCSKRTKRLLFLALWMLVHIYLAVAAWNSWSMSESWCHGVKSLLLIVLLLHICTADIVLRSLGVWTSVRRIKEYMYHSLADVCTSCFCTPFLVKGLVYGISYSVLVGFLAYDSAPELDGLVSFCGLVLFVCLSCLFSKSPNHIPWDSVLSGVLFQYLLGLVLLRSDFGRRLVQCVGDLALHLTDFSEYGARFVFGYLVDGQLAGVKQKQPGIFVFTMLPNVIFFGFLINVLFYYGVAQWTIVKVGWLMHHIIGTTAGESTAAIANIFLGTGEATLLIRPYISRMTISELHCTMTVGIASMSAGLFNAFSRQQTDPLHIMASSILSAPAGLVAAKLWYPETQVSVTHYGDIDTFKSPESSALEAAAVGITSVLSMLPIIAATLIVFMSFIAFADDAIQHLGNLVGLHSFNIKELVATIFFPGVLFLVIDRGEARRLSSILSAQAIENELHGFARFHDESANAGLTMRTRTVATYVLCGFSNLSTIGIQLGALGAVAPSRIADLSVVVLRASVAGFVACFFTACVAGSLITSKANPTLTSFNATDFL
ncbi:solute carrier family 28 member 3-like isoform X2 [Ornithodoros turicata]|uniref:solute carrier family 28 member 3-like isoform X2 n=1 Tax=Ornithodoros turicata TaxID=34597 RepID=UPI003139B5BC